jgi:hypothetical protein
MSINSLDKGPKDPKTQVRDDVSKALHTPAAQEKPKGDIYLLTTEQLDGLEPGTELLTMLGEKVVVGKEPLYDMMSEKYTGYGFRKADWPADLGEPKEPAKWTILGSVSSW